MKNKCSGFLQVGWWVPGSLLPNWQNESQGNFNDMSNKIKQLKLVPLVDGPKPNKRLGFFFSQAEFDFIQLLSCEKKQQKASTIVAYSVWLANQGWAHFSPIPLLQYSGDGCTSDNLSQGEGDFANEYPLGWYLTGTFSSAWYKDLNDSYRQFNEKVKSLGIKSLSYLYSTQSTLYQFIKMIQLPLDKQLTEQNKIADLINWFMVNEFGSINAIPFMDASLLVNAVEESNKTP